MREKESVRSRAIGLLTFLDMFFVLDAQCVSEMTNLMTCWKRNGFEDSHCTREVNSFMDCVSKQVMFYV